MSEDVDGPAAALDRLERLATAVEPAMLEGEPEIVDNLVDYLRPMAQAEGRFEVYSIEAGEWRWRLVHQNGKIIADSGQGYASKQNAQQGIESVKRNAPGATVFVPLEDADVDD